MATERGRLFVDGYNVLHDWHRIDGAPRLNTATARQEIIEAVRVIVDVEQWEATVVFDGREFGGRLQATESGSAVSVVFAPEGLTADGVIERLVAANARISRCIVVTADRMERETVMASGAECLTPKELAQWIEWCRQRVRRRPPGGSQLENKLPL